MAQTLRGRRRVSSGGRLRRHLRVPKKDGRRRMGRAKSPAPFKFQRIATSDTKETGAPVLSRGAYSVACDPSLSVIEADELWGGLLKAAQDAKPRMRGRAYMGGLGGTEPNCRPIAELVSPEGPTE